MGTAKLFDEYGRYAAEHSALVLTATATADGEPLGVAEQLWQSPGVSDEIAERAGELIRDHRTGANVLPGRSIVELANLIVGLAGRSPVVVEIDDFQLADDASVTFVEHLRRWQYVTKLLLIIGELDWQAPAGGRPSARIARYPHLRLSLAPMTEAEIEDALTAALGTAAVHHAPAIHELSGGNSSLVAALIEDNRLATGPAVVGPAYGHAVLDCFRSAEPRILTVARGLALLDEHATPALTGELVACKAEFVELVTDLLVRSGLHTTDHFRHPAAAAALLDTMPAGDRTASHVRAAELLYARGAVPSVVARHLVAADQPVLGWSQAVLVAAADHGLTAGDAGFAIRCLMLAHRSSVDEAQRGTISNSLVRAGWRVSPSEAGRHLASLRRAADEGALVARDAFTLIRSSLWSGDRDLLGKALRALVALPDGIDPRARAELTLAWQWCYGKAPDELTGGSRDDPWTKSLDALCTVWTRGGSAATTLAAEQVLRSSQGADISLEMVATAINALLAAGESDRADWWCTQLLETATARGAITWQALLTVVRSSVSMRRGELLTAAAQASAGFNLLDTRGWGVVIGFPIGMVVRTNLAVGRLDVAAQALRHPLPEAIFDTVGGLQYLHVRGQYHLANDQLLAAVSDFEECQRLARKLQFEMPAVIPWEADLARAHLRLGEIDIARDMARARLDRAGPMDNRGRGHLLRVLAEASPAGERVAPLREAVVCLARAGDTVELASALTELAAACGAESAPFALLREHMSEDDLAMLIGKLRHVHYARGEFDRARALDQWARNDIGSLPAGTIRSDIAGSAKVSLLVLSEAERRVAELAVRGHTNREIGDRLYVTTSTVEQHLTRVYRKLGVGGRSQLPTDLLN